MVLRLTSLLVALLLVFAVAGSAAAAKPSRGCPNPKFELMTIGGFQELSRSLGVPEDLITESEPVLEEIDQNDDGLLCVMDLPDTPGTLGGWIFNVIDNVANR